MRPRYRVDRYSFTRARIRVLTLFPVNLECIIGDKERAYPDHREKSTDRTKNGLGWCRARDLLRKVQGLDGYIQQGERVFSAFLLGICIHGRENSVARQRCAEEPEPNTVERPFRLVQMNGRGTAEAICDDQFGLGAFLRT